MWRRKIGALAIQYEFLVSSVNQDDFHDNQLAYVLIEKTLQ